MSPDDKAVPKTAVPRLAVKNLLCILENGIISTKIGKQYSLLGLLTPLFLVVDHIYNFNRIFMFKTIEI